MEKPLYHPLLSRYRISVTAEDSTGEMQIILGDREVRTLMGKRARQLLEEVKIVIAFTIQGLFPYFSYKTNYRLFYLSIKAHRRNRHATVLESYWRKRVHCAAEN